MPEDTPPHDSPEEEEEEEEAEAVPINPYVVHPSYVHSTCVLDSDTSHTIDAVGLGERLAELHGDSVVLLRRQEVCEWFAELPAEETPPPESAAMKTALAGGEPSPQLLAAAFQCKIASTAANEVADHEAMLEQRARQIKDAAETRQQLLDAGETVLPEEDFPDITPLADRKALILFQNYPQTMPELLCLQSGSWVAQISSEHGEGLFPSKLQTIHIVNSQFAFRKTADGGDAKAAKTDPKKAKPKGKGGKGEEGGEGEPLLILLQQELQGLQDSVEDHPLREVHLRTFTLLNTWFGTALAETETEVFDRLLSALETMHDRWQLFSAWRQGKYGREVAISPMESLELPPPPPPEVQAVEESAPKGGAKKNKKPDEEPAPQEDPTPEPPPPPPLSPRSLPCHRRYYDTLLREVAGQGPPGVASVVECLVEQTVRNKECRKHLAVAGQPTQDDTFDLDEEAEAGPAVTVLAHEVEDTQKGHDHSRHQDSLLDYIDTQLARADRKQLLATKQKEKIHQQDSLSRELYLPEAADLEGGFSGAQQAQRLFRIGQAIEMTVGPHTGTRGTVVGHSRGRVGVHLETGERLGTVAFHLKPIRCSTNGAVPYGNAIALKRVNEVPSLRGVRPSDCESQALEKVAGTMLTAPSRKVVLEASNDVDNTTEMTERHIAHTAALLSLEKLLIEVGAPLSLSHCTYEEELDRETLLQHLRDASAAGMQIASAWHDEAARTALLVTHHPFGEQRYRWRRTHASYSGKVFFSQWLKWRDEIAEHERTPEVFTFEEEEKENPEDAEGEAEGGEPAPSTRREPIPPPPVDPMVQMRERAQITHLQRLLAEGPTQHIASTTTRDLSEERTVLYPSDGGVVTVSRLEGNTHSVRCTVEHEEVTVGSSVDLQATSGSRHPVSLAATFPDGSALCVSVAAAETSLRTKVEYCCTDALQVKMLPAGEVEMKHSTTDTAPEQTPPEERNTAPITFSTKVTEPSPLRPSDAANRSRVVQVYDEEHGTIHGIVTREVLRCVLGSTVLCTMADGTRTSLLSDGTVATLYRGSWLVTKNAAQYVIRYGSEDPEEVAPALVSTNRDAESKALITTRSDMTLTVSYDLGDGSTIAAHNDGTLIWSRTELTVTSADELNGTYRQCGHKNGRPSFVGGESSLCFDNGTWVFANGTTASNNEPCPQNPGHVKAWSTPEGKPAEISVSLKKQVRVEAAGFATVEQSDADMVQVNTTDDAILVWTPHAVELHKPDTTVLKVSLADLLVRYQPSSIRKKDSTHTPDKTSSAEGVYQFDLLHGGMRVVDYDWSTFEVSLRGNVVVTPYDAVAENHPDTEAETRMPIDRPINEALYTLGGGRPYVDQEGASGRLTLHPRQAPEGCVPGGIRTPSETHPPGLYLFDLCKGRATRFLAPAAVLGYLNHVQGDPNRSVLARSDVPGENNVQEIEVRTKCVPETCLHLGKRLLPKVVAETQCRAGRLSGSTPARGRVLAYNNAAISTANEEENANEEPLIIRRLVQFPEVLEEHRRTVHQQLSAPKEAAVRRTQHATATAVNDTTTEEELKQETHVAARLEEAIVAQARRSSRTNLHETHKKDIASLEGEAVAYWHTKEGLAAVSQCVVENEKYKTHKAAPKETALVPQPPPAEKKTEASPHGQATLGRQEEPPSVEAAVEQGCGFDSEKFAQLTAIVCAGPHKSSLDACKARLRQKDPPDCVRAVFEALCVLLNEAPSWTRALNLFTGPMAHAGLMQAVMQRENVCI